MSSVAGPWTVVGGDDVSPGLQRLCRGGGDESQEEEAGGFHGAGAAWRRSKPGGTAKSLSTRAW